MNSKRDEKHFLSLVDEHKKILYKVAQSYCANPDDRRDLMQEITVQLWRSFGRYDPRYRFSTWMYRIAMNVAISFYRTLRVERSCTVAMEESVLEIAAPEAESDDVRQLRLFIQQLDELDRALLILYLDGNSHDDIAEILGITTTNVATKISRIKQRLRRDFDSQKEINHGTR